MNHHIKTAIAFLTCAFAIPDFTNAETTFDIGDVEVAASSLASQVTVPVTVTTTDGDSLLSYDLPVDVSTPGRGLASGVTFAGNVFAPDTPGRVDVVNVAGFGNTSTQTEDLPPVLTQLYETIVSDDGPALAIGGGLTLFNLLIDLDSSFVPGDVIPISISTGGNLPAQFQVETSLLGSITEANFAGSGVTVLAGSITVTGEAIPEPTSAVLLVAGLAGVAMRRKRRV